MQLENVRSYEDLQTYLREFSNFGGDSVPYDFVGAFFLFHAILENLTAHSIDADLESLRESGPCLTQAQLNFLQKLVAQ